MKVKIAVDNLSSFQIGYVIGILVVVLSLCLTNKDRL